MLWRRQKSQANDNRWDHLPKVLSGGFLQVEIWGIFEKGIGSVISRHPGQDVFFCSALQNHNILCMFVFPDFMVDLQ